jgi:hypothetical protein
MPVDSPTHAAVPRLQSCPHVQTLAPPLPTAVGDEPDRPRPDLLRGGTAVPIVIILVRRQGADLLLASNVNEATILRSLPRAGE